MFRRFKKRREAKKIVEYINKTADAMDEVKSSAQEEHKQRVADAAEVRDGKYVGWKYRVWRDSSSKFIVQRYDGYVLPDDAFGRGYDGWITAIYDVPDALYKGNYRSYLDIGAKQFDSIEEAAKAAQEYAARRKRQWEAQQLIGPVQDLGRLP